MRHLCVLLLLVLGLSVCSGGYCYKKHSYQSWWGTKYRSVRECCSGYCGPYCACTRVCYDTVYYEGSCCPKDCPNGGCLKKREVLTECKPCTKSRQEPYCCNNSSSGVLCYIYDN